MNKLKESLKNLSSKKKLAIVLAVITLIFFCVLIIVVIALLTSKKPNIDITLPITTSPTNISTTTTVTPEDKEKYKVSINGEVIAEDIISYDSAEYFVNDILYTEDSKLFYYYEGNIKRYDRVTKKVDLYPFLEVLKSSPGYKALDSKIDKSLLTFDLTPLGEGSYILSAVNFNRVQGINEILSINDIFILNTSNKTISLVDGMICEEFNYFCIVSEDVYKLSNGKYLISNSFGDDCYSGSQFYTLDILNRKIEKVILTENGCTGESKNPSFAGIINDEILLYKRNGQDKLDTFYSYNVITGKTNNISGIVNKSYNTNIDKLYEVFSLDLVDKLINGKYLVRTSNLSMGTVHIIADFYVYDHSKYSLNKILQTCNRVGVDCVDNSIPSFEKYFKDKIVLGNKNNDGSTKEFILLNLIDSSTSILYSESEILNIGEKVNSDTNCIYYWSNKSHSCDYKYVRVGYIEDSEGKVLNEGYYKLINLTKKEILTFKDYQEINNFLDRNLPPTILETFKEIKIERQL